MVTPEPPAIYRAAARILLLSVDDRVLLFRTDVRRRPLWITPGGGCEAGESFEKAAQRELWEETGLRTKLGPCIWTRRHTASKSEPNRGRRIAAVK